jgi:HEPN domain-containing protein
MNRSDLQKLASLRIKDAKTLLDNDRYEGSYYLAGYAVECALKACIAKKTKRFDFPDKELANKSYTHKLGDLVRLAGMEGEPRKAEKSSREFEENWAVVKDWTEEHRYRTVISKKLAGDLYSAIVSKKYGVLTWLRNSW